MSSPEEDIKQIPLLSTFHYVLGGVTGFFSCFPLIHVAVGILSLLSGGIGSAVFGLLFVIIGLSFVVLGWALAICMFITASNLKKKIRYRFCFVIACIECAFMPLGTILGVLSIIALSKDSVKAAFQEGETRGDNQRG